MSMPMLASSSSAFSASLIISTSIVLADVAAWQLDAELFGAGHQLRVRRFRHFRLGRLRVRLWLAFAFGRTPSAAAQAASQQFLACLSAK